MSEEIVWFPLLDFESEYEIAAVYPHSIRKKSNKRILKESFNDKRIQNDYIIVWLNKKKYYKHVLIGRQFIENDDPTNKNQIDHINRDKTDNHISNLRWVSQSENQLNLKTKKGIQYEYADSLPDGYIKVDSYIMNNKTYLLENYYYCDETFYQFNNIKYRKLYIYHNKWGSRTVSLLLSSLSMKTSSPIS
ncbi:hypothetical protein M9Y10_042820 [Tritrichomonas musculus]|uniref:HNH nuclease domain-containing protein n=1 Tax=Tritrichomonas musculus TaxID=1915356 RepID=A0ABR2JYD1_9EUKA